jgi:hypothetical protein
MPVKDDEDPDTYPKETPLAKPPAVITGQQAQALADLLVTKRGKNVQIQADFLAKMDQVMINYGTPGATNTGNFRLRLANLTEPDYQRL